MGKGLSVQALVEEEKRRMKEAKTVTTQRRCKETSGDEMLSTEIVRIYRCSKCVPFSMRLAIVEKTKCEQHNVWRVCHLQGQERCLQNPQSQ
jgi:hypothetical protein